MLLSQREISPQSGSENHCALSVIWKWKEEQNVLVEWYCLGFSHQSDNAGFSARINMFKKKEKKRQSTLIRVLNPVRVRMWNENVVLIHNTQFEACYKRSGLWRHAHRALLPMVSVIQQTSPGKKNHYCEAVPWCPLAFCPQSTIQRTIHHYV